MKNAKLIVFDVGNTLISTAHGLSMSTQLIRDLNALKKRGYILGCSTLRTEDMIAPILAQFGFDFLVLMNGALVKIGNDIISSKPLELTDVRMIEKQASKVNVEVKEYTFDGRIYALELLGGKGCYIDTDNFESYVWERSGNIDLTAKGITKLSGLEIVCRQLDITLDKVVAFGDGYNDVDIFKAVGFSVAMGGAPNELREVASMDTASAEDDGICIALRKMELI